MTGITTHILDVSRGLPAPGVVVRLEQWRDENWVSQDESATDDDGRARFLETAPEIGNYRLTFEIVAYFEELQTPAFYPFVQIVFTVSTSRHHHVPLLLSPFGFSTYRGS